MGPAFLVVLEEEALSVEAWLVVDADEEEPVVAVASVVWWPVVVSWLVVVPVPVS